MPGVLFLHGWGGSQEQDLKKAADIAALGCVCLTFDMRGHARWESQRETVTREDNLKDVLAASDELVRRPGVDVSAIAVVETLPALNVSSTPSVNRWNTLGEGAAEPAYFDSRNSM